MSDTDILLNALNPDKEGIYYVWHYCIRCEMAFKHSQLEWENHKDHLYVTFENKKYGREHDEVSEPL